MKKSTRNLAIGSVVAIASVGVAYYFITQGKKTSLVITVVDPQGSPIPNAFVTLDTPHLLQITNDQGEVVFNGVSPGVHTVIIQAGTTTLTKSFTASPNSQGQMLVTIDPNVRNENLNSSNACLDPTTHNYVSVGAIQSGSVMYCPDNVTASSWIQCLAGNPPSWQEETHSCPVKVPPPSGAPPGVPVRVCVIEGDTGQPFGYSTVTIQPAGVTYTTDQSGCIMLYNLIVTPGETIEVTASPPPSMATSYYPSRTITFTVPQLAAGQTYFPISIAIDKTTGPPLSSQTVTAEVSIVGCNNSPVIQGTVIMTNSAGVTYTASLDSSGTATFNNMPVGTYQPSISVPGETLSLGSGPVTVQANPSSFTFQFCPRPDLSCTNSNECGGSNYICLNNQCVPFNASECTTDSDCMPGNVCDAGVCEPSSSTSPPPPSGLTPCTSDSNCPSGYFCAYGYCQQSGVQPPPISQTCTSGTVKTGSIQYCSDGRTIASELVCNPDGNGYSQVTNACPNTGGSNGLPSNEPCTWDGYGSGGGESDCDICLCGNTFYYINCGNPKGNCGTQTTNPSNLPPSSSCPNTVCESPCVVDPVTCACNCTPGGAPPPPPSTPGVCPSGWQDNGGFVNSQGQHCRICYCPGLGLQNACPGSSLGQCISSPSPSPPPSSQPPPSSGGGTFTCYGTTCPQGWVCCNENGLGYCLGPGQSCPAPAPTPTSPPPSGGGGGGNTPCGGTICLNGWECCDPSSNDCRPAGSCPAISPTQPPPSPSPSPTPTPSPSPIPTSPCASYGQIQCNGFCCPQGCSCGAFSCQCGVQGLGIVGSVKSYAW